MLGHFFPLREAARIGRVRKLIAGIAAVALYAQTAGATDNPPPGTATWVGINWGIGIAADFDVSGGRAVSADNVNGIVRVSNSSNSVGVSFVLEAHYFFGDNLLPFGVSPGECAKRAQVLPYGYL